MKVIEGDFPKNRNNATAMEIAEEIVTNFEKVVKSYLGETAVQEVVNGVRIAIMAMIEGHITSLIPGVEPPHAG